MILTHGLVLMVIGMTFVFVFLYLLVLIMNLLAVVVPRFNQILPDLAPKAVTAAPAAAKTAPARSDAVIAIAIAAADIRQS